MDIKLLELDSDYIISSFGQITATGLSRALSGTISHDKITRFLSKEDLDSKKLWKRVKPVIREHEKEDGVLIVDDTIEKKPVRGWLKGLDFPVLIYRQVFTNKDGSTGMVYLACSDLNCDTFKIETVYARTVERGSLS